MINSGSSCQSSSTITCKKKLLKNRRSLSNELITATAYLQLTACNISSLIGECYRFKYFDSKKRRKYQGKTFIGNSFTETLYLHIQKRIKCFLFRCHFSTNCTNFHPSMTFCFIMELLSFTVSKAVLSHFYMRLRLLWPLNPIWHLQRMHKACWKTSTTWKIKLLFSIVFIYNRLLFYGGCHKCSFFCHQHLFNVWEKNEEEFIICIAYRFQIEGKSSHWNVRNEKRKQRTGHISAHIH